MFQSCNKMTQDVRCVMQLCDLRTPLCTLIANVFNESKYGRRIRYPFCVGTPQDDVLWDMNDLKRQSKKVIEVPFWAVFDFQSPTTHVRQDTAPHI
jgi:hypothetical protein